MEPVDPGPSDQLEALRAAVSARAAGWWQVYSGRLGLVAFAAAADLPEEVAREFAAATQSIALEPSGLGIVKAALAGETAESRAADLPPDAGSGLWLRRFGAARSVAVPLRDASGHVVGVVSVALGEEPPRDAIVALLKGVSDSASALLDSPSN
jgi:DNA-binding IclR family transcriptional regulator